MKLIIYTEDGNSVKVLSPSLPLSTSLEQLAEKDLPGEVIWRVVDDKDLPITLLEQWQWTSSGPLLVTVNIEQISAEIRARRNNLLQQSDWTQVADAPVDQAAWVTYRQALRDVTKQEGFPEAVVWPVAP